MKPVQIIFASMIVILFICAIGCSNESSEKQKVICFYKKSCESLEQSRDLSKEVEKVDEFAKSCGFKDANEVSETVVKYLEDPEIQQWTDKYAQLTDQINSETQKALDKEMDKSAQPQADTAAKPAAGQSQSK